MRSRTKADPLTSATAMWTLLQVGIYGTEYCRSKFGFRVLGFGCWVLGAVCVVRVLAAWCWVLVLMPPRIPNPECPGVPRIPNPARIPNPESRDQLVTLKPTRSFASPAGLDAVSSIRYSPGARLAS